MNNQTGNSVFRETALQDQPLNEQQKRTHSSRVGLLIVGSLLAAALVAWFAIGKLHGLGTHSSISRSRLTVATVRRGEFIRDVSADGKIIAAVSPTLYAPAAGTLTLLVHAGDTLSAGDSLAKLDNPELTARLSQEQASLQSAKLEFQRARMDTGIQLMQTQQAYEKAKVDAEAAARELDRSRKAHDLGAYSELQVSRAQDTLEKAKFSLAEAGKTLAARPQQNRFEVDGRHAFLERQQFLVDELQRQVDSLTIKSPVAGQVGRVEAADRAAVAKDAPLLTVVDLSALEVEIQVPESLARDLKISMPANLSGSGSEWRGHVSAVSPEVVNGQVTARVSFDPPKPVGLRQNQRISVLIVLDKRSNVLSVDRGSFFDQDGGGFAYVISGDTARRRPIHLGAVSLGKVEIRDGLKEGDQVIVSGAEGLEGAANVTVSE